MPKTWYVYPWLLPDPKGAAKQSVVQVVDPKDPGVVVTLRVSERDAKAVLKAMRTPGTPPGFAWQFDDAVEAVYRRKLPPLPKSASKKPKG